MIQLYAASTPNGHKASCVLDEREIALEVRPLNLLEGAQKTVAFLTLNPNGRIPVIVDRANDNRAVFESGVIMVYLAEEAGRLLPTESKARARVMSWLMFQIGGVGPMMSQAYVVFRSFPNKIPAAIERCQNEIRRLFEVLDRRMGESEWLGDDCSIADIASWCWVRTHNWSVVSREGLENLERWLLALQARPALQRGVAAPFSVDKLIADKDAPDRFAEGGRALA